MRIALDLDDVVLDFVGHIRTCLQREYGETLPEITTFEALGRDVAALTGLGDDLWGWLRQRDWLWATAPAVEGAIGGIRQLRDAGHHIEILTAKPEWAEWVVWAWMGKWRPAAHRVTVVPVGAQKWNYSQAHILVDDNAAQVAQWVRLRGSAVLFDRPWNWDSGLARAMTWPQLTARLLQMGSGRG